MLSNCSFTGVYYIPVYTFGSVSGCSLCMLFNLVDSRASRRQRGILIPLCPWWAILVGLSILRVLIAGRVLA